MADRSPDRTGIDLRASSLHGSMTSPSAVRGEVSQHMINSLMDETEVNLLFVERRLQQERDASASLARQLASERKRAQLLEHGQLKLRSALDDQTRAFEAFKAEVASRLTTQRDIDLRTRTTLEVERNELATEVGRLKAQLMEMESLRATYARSRANNETLQSEVVAERNRVMNAEDRLRAVEDTNASLEASLRNEREKTSMQESEIHRLDVKIKTLESQVRMQETQAQNTIEEAKARIQDATGQIADARAEHDRELGRERANYEATISNLESRLRSYEATISDNMTKLSTAQGQRSGLEVALAEAELRLQREMDKGAELRGENMSLADRVRSLEAVLDAKDDRIRRNYARLSGLRERVYYTARQLEEHELELGSP